MRTWALGAACLLVACNSTGSKAQPGNDSGVDATTGDASEDATDAAEELEAEPPCLPLTAGNPSPSADCIYAGACPLACGMGTQSAYACNAASVPIPDAGAYPSAFEVPVGIVTVVGYDPSAYPWEAGAFVSCAPLTCVRWATADHVDGGSTWPTDPCGTPDAAPFAWVCPPFPGVIPAADAGCTNAGGMNDIGGQGTGVPAQAVWCCGGSLPVEATDAGSDASPADAATDTAEDSSGE
jgi:hypothetical protein